VRRGDYQEAREDRRELREDRRELREDWRSYRRANRGVYNRPDYAGPRGHRYRPVSIGFRFEPAYYGQRYWVNDYARYRLPRPGPNRRWIRYGNDVVLINVRNGRVVQVYRNFYW
jgi:Ni/Co efflux regulator RcnB